MSYHSFTPISERMPPACQDILAAVPHPKRKGHFLTITLYTGTHPQECVEDGVVAWMLTPQYTPKAEEQHIKEYDRGKIEFCPKCGESAVVNACDCIP